NDDGAPPAIVISDASLSEGNAGTVSADFVVSLSSAPTAGQSVMVSYATADGTATVADSDYASTSGVLSYGPGETSKTVSVLVNGDARFEANETFFVNLSGASGGTIADPQGAGTIVNDDAAPPNITISDVSVVEGNTGDADAAFVVTLSSAPSTGQSVSVNFATADGTATVANNDYVARTGALVFNAGQTTRTVHITVNGDSVYEPNETFFVNLSGAVGGTITDAQGQGTISNDDAAPPSISIGDVTVAEGNSGTTAADFVVTLSSAPSTGQTVTVDFATADGTATVAGADYASTTGTVSFGAGETSKTVSVTVNGDTLAEPDETFLVNLS